MSVMSDVTKIVVAFLLIEFVGDYIKDGPSERQPYDEFRFSLAQVAVECSPDDEDCDRLLWAADFALSFEYEKWSATRATMNEYFLDHIPNAIVREVYEDAELPPLHSDDGLEARRALCERAVAIAAQANKLEGAPESNLAKCTRSWQEYGDEKMLRYLVNMAIQERWATRIGT